MPQEDLGSGASFIFLGPSGWLLEANLIRVGLMMLLLQLLQLLQSCADDDDDDIGPIPSHADVMPC